MEKVSQNNQYQNTASYCQPSEGFILSYELQHLSKITYFVTLKGDTVQNSPDKEQLQTSKSHNQRKQEKKHSGGGVGSPCPAMAQQWIS